MLQDRKLTRREFLTALHLVLLKKSGLDLPPRVPHRLVDPRDRRPSPGIRLAEVEPDDRDRDRVAAADAAGRRRLQLNHQLMADPVEYHKRLARAFSSRRNFHRSAGLAGAHEGMDYMINELENRFVEMGFFVTLPGNRTKIADIFAAEVPYKLQAARASHANMNT